ncbi:MAG: NAD(+)/NADH kinase [Phycisphaerales bacterium]
MGRRVLLLVNPSKPAAAKAAAEVRELVKLHGTLVGEEHAESGLLPAEFRRADLYVVFGGDGTLLAQSRRCAGPGNAMLGVNMGKVGFLAAFDMPAMRARAHELFGATPLPINEYNLLKVEVFGRGDEHPRFSTVALNDAVIVAGPPYRLITLTIYLNGEAGPTIRGDGLIVSSPVGSTAYNLSAGGPAVDPSVDAMAITPIAPQSLSFRPVVVSGSARIEITADKVNADAGGMGTTLSLDGQVQAPLKAGDRIVITRNEHGVRFVLNDASDWWSRLISRLQWAAAPKMSSS